MEKNLQDFISEAQSGSHEAFREVFERVHHRVFSYALSHVKSRDDALDITQDIFIDLWRGLPGFSYRSEEEFYGFIFRIVKRKLARYYKKNERSSPVLQEDADPSYEADYHEDHRVLLSHIETLADKYQELLRLRYWGGMKLAEAAAILGINESTAKVWHYRALQTLRARMPNLD